MAATPCGRIFDVPHHPAIDMKTPLLNARRNLVAHATPLFTAVALLLPATFHAAPVAQKFASSGTFSPPAGVTSVTVECWGGGGAGGSAQRTTANAGGGGGGGGAYARKTISVSFPNSYTVTIPDAVAAPLSGFAAGDRVDGASVTFTGDGGESVTANGGQGGECAINSTGNGGAGGAAGAGLDEAWAGGNGAKNTSGNAGAGGSAASDDLAGFNATANSSTAPGTTPGTNSDHSGGSGGAGRTGSNVGNVGVAPGGGGGGGRSGPTAETRRGGAGGKGQIIITYEVALANAKANNALPLNQTASWTSAVPGSTDPAIWDGTVGGPNTTVLGSNLAFGSIQILNPGGAVTIDTGNTLTLGDAVTDIDLGSSTADLTLNCNLALGDDNEWTVSSIRTLTIGGSISGTGAIAKKGAGLTVLSGDNTYASLTDITAGTLKILHANALGNVSDFTQVANSAGLLLEGGISFAAEELFVASGTATSAQLRNVSGNNTWNGAIFTTGSATAVRISSEADLLTLAGTVTGATPTQVVLQGQGDILVTGKITGTSPFTSSNLNNLGVASTVLGTRTLSNTSNDFTGKINVNGGTLVLNGVGTTGNASNEVSVGAVAATSSGRLDLGGFSHTVGPVSVNSAPPTGDAISNGSLTGTSYSVTNATGIPTISANLLGSGVALTKSGAGQAILTGTNTYTGATTINAGNLRVNTPGSLAAGSTVTANNDSTIGGDGTINGNVIVTGSSTDHDSNPVTPNVIVTAKLAPGATSATGVLTVGGDLDITDAATHANAGTFFFGLGAVGSSDQVNAGTLHIGIGQLGFNDFSFSDVAGFGAGIYKLITTTGGITGTLNGASLTGVIAGLDATLAISLDGKDLELTVATAGGDYASWATLNGIGSEPFDDDFDHDGISNGVEYALGLNPTTSSQPPGVLSGNIITFTKGEDAIANGDVSWVIETSTTLAAGSWTAEVTQTPGDPGEPLPAISYTFTPGTPVRKFARLKVAQIP
jgi:autotransporter-associated beta strand protein